MILTQKEKGRDRENNALHLCVCQRWIGFSEDDGKQAAEGARFLASRKPRFSCQRVPPLVLLKVDDALRPVALGEFLSRFGLGLSRLGRC
jgi:hypothetical protein